MDLVLGDVLVMASAKPGLAEETLVLAVGHEQEEADRAPRRDLIAGDDAGDDDRVGVEEHAARTEQAAPFGEDGGTVGGGG